MRLHALSLLTAIALGDLAGCSDEHPAKPMTAPAASAPQAGAPSAAGPQNLALPARPAAKAGYRVADTFNVGDHTYVRSMAYDAKNDNLWVGTSVGVLQVDVPSRRLLNTYTREQGLANEYVFGILVDSQGNRWFGTNGGGISRFSPDGQWKTYFPMHGLADYWIYSFAEDSKGGLWIGTWAGLSHFEPKTEQFNTYLTELVNEWVYGLGVDSHDRVWIGTEGGMNMFDGEKWYTWTHKDGLGAGNENNLPVSTNTGLGTRSRHDLSIMAEGRETYNPNYVFTLIVAKDDTVWAGTWGGGVAHYDGQQWHNFTTRDGLGGNIVYSIAQDEDGAFWFGTSGGLTRYDGKTWDVFTRTDGLLDNNVYAIVPTGGGKVWVGTRSGVTLLSK